MKSLCRKQYVVSVVALLPLSLFCLGLIAAAPGGTASDVVPLQNLGDFPGGGDRLLPALRAAKAYGSQAVSSEVICGKPTMAEMLHIPAIEISIPLALQFFQVPAVRGAANSTVSSGPVLTTPPSMQFFLVPPVAAGAGSVLLSAPGGFSVPLRVEPHELFTVHGTFDAGYSLPVRHH